MRALLVAVLMAGCRVHFDPLATTDDGDPDADLTTYREAVLADNPLSYWRLDDTTTAVTDVQQTVPGVFTGNCTFGVPGALAQDTNTAVHFDGVDCKASFGDNFRFPGTSPLTIELWVRPSRMPAYEHYFTLQVRSGNVPVDGYALFRDNGGPIGVMVERAIASQIFTTNPTEININEWAYLVMEYDGAFEQLYINGVLVQQLADARAMNVVGAVALLGAHMTSAYFMGDMDEVAVYDHTLSPAQLNLHYQIGVNGPQ